MKRLKHAPERPRLEGTTRIEAFSDGVIAIIATLLVLELRVPHVAEPSTPALWQALGALAPKFLSFAVSFFTAIIFWVNHHHFLHRITHSDYKLMWLNSGLLFWLSILPFTTAYLGDYPTQPLAIALYALTLCMASLAFTLMGHYAFFTGGLIESTVSNADRRREWHRSFFATGAYALTALMAFVYVPAALTLIVLLPFLYVVPGLLRRVGE